MYVQKCFDFADMLSSLRSLKKTLVCVIPDDDIFTILLPFRLSRVVALMKR